MFSRSDLRYAIDNNLFDAKKNPDSLFNKTQISEKTSTQLNIWSY